MDFDNTNQLLQAVLVCFCVFALIAGYNSGNRL